jgi:hypothetical protein
MALLELFARTAEARIVASNLAPIGGISRHGFRRTPRRACLVPACARRVGKCPDQQRTNGLGKLIVVLKRHVQGNSVDTIGRARWLKLAMPACIVR